MPLPILGSYSGSRAQGAPNRQNGPMRRNELARLRQIEARIQEVALGIPEAYEDRPWGDFPVFKVGQNKLFGWAVTRDESVDVTMKLTAEEREIAHLLP